MMLWVLYIRSITDSNLNDPATDFEVLWTFVWGFYIDLLSFCLEPKHTTISDVQGSTYYPKLSFRRDTNDFGIKFRC